MSDQVDPRVYDAAATAPFVPAPDVISGLGKSSLPREARAAMAAFSSETLVGNPPSWPYAWSPFRCEFGFREWNGSLDTFPAWGGNSAHNTHAIGVWQDEPETYAEIVALTGDASFQEQSQIANNWVLAVRDYKTRRGGDLLAALQAGQLDTVSPALIATWPGGADAGFPARYGYALTLFPIDTPAPPPPPAGPLEIPLGEQCTVAILSATDRHGTPIAYLPADLLRPDDPTICSAVVTPPNLTIQTLALGSTVLRGADQAVPISVIAPAVAHLVLDLAHPVFAPLVATAKAAIAQLPMLAMAGAIMLALAQPADVPVFLFKPIPIVEPQAAAARPLSLCERSTFRLDRDLRPEPIRQCR